MVRMDKLSRMWDYTVVDSGSDFLKLVGPFCVARTRRGTASGGPIIMGSPPILPPLGSPI